MVNSLLFNNGKWAFDQRVNVNCPNGTTATTVKHEEYAPAATGGASAAASHRVRPLRRRRFVPRTTTRHLPGTNRRLTDWRVRLRE